jgi:hypothetical protein
MLLHNLICIGFKRFQFAFVLLQGTEFVLSAANQIFEFHQDHMFWPVHCTAALGFCFRHLLENTEQLCQKYLIENMPWVKYFGTVSVLGQRGGTHLFCFTSI